jgi:hypothetical protein
MKDQEYIEFHGKKYNLIFDLNVMQDIQEEYGTFDKWAKLTLGNTNGEHSTKAVLFAIMCMINEGIEIDNEKKEVKDPLLTQRQVGRMMTEVGMAQTVDKLQQVIIKSTDSDKSSKNE